MNETTGNATQKQNKGKIKGVEKELTPGRTKNKLKGVFSHNTDDWRTPTKLYNYFIKELKCIDPFPFKSKTDNFKKIYKHKNIFINPPFSKLKEIPKFIKNNISVDNFIYLLIPARTDTKYFHELLELTPNIYFIKGRLKFNDKGSAPFPSILLVFNKMIIIPQYSIFELVKSSK